MTMTTPTSQSVEPKPYYSQEVPAPPAYIPSPPLPYVGSKGLSAEKKDDSADEELGDRRKSVAYPSHKFYMTQFVKDGCRIRRWVYEDATPLTMESNMKHMLKVASTRLATCQSDKERRGEMLKDLNEMAAILEDKI